MLRPQSVDFLVRRDLSYVLVQIREMLRVELRQRLWLPALVVQEVGGRGDEFTFCLHLICAK